MVGNQTAMGQFPVDSGQVEIQGGNIFYTRYGARSQGSPILFLHGWAIAAEPYTAMLMQLAPHHSVIAPDLPGFARSSIPNFHPDYDRYANLLGAFLDALNLPSVHLVGHSLGGGIAITLAALMPGRVRSVTLVDSTGVPMVSLSEIVPRRAIEMTAQFFLPGLELKLVEIPKVFTNNLLCNTGNVIQALLLSLQGSLKHRLPNIQAPCLLLWSEKDLTTPIAAAQTMATLIPHATLKTVTEGWHEWALWYPERFTEILLDFIQSVERQAAIAVE